MFDQSTIAIYDKLEQAENAVAKLNKEKFPIDRISLVAQNLESNRDIHGFVSVRDFAKTDAETGAWVGGIFGLLSSVAFFWVPGAGPLLVAGPLAGALLGAAKGSILGAVGGGLLGVLKGWGVGRKHILKYEEHLKGGKFLVIAHGSENQVNKAREILKSTGAKSLKIHAEFK